MEQKFAPEDVVYFHDRGIHKGTVLFAYTFEDKQKETTVYLIEKSTLGDRFNRFALLPEGLLHRSKSSVMNAIDFTK